LNRRRGWSDGPAPNASEDAAGWQLRRPRRSPHPRRRWRSTAIDWLTSTSSEPAGTRIFASTPSSTASTSIVALSVSISAMTSPGLTGSPSFYEPLG
jgi:hypothetical protein